MKNKLTLEQWKILWVLMKAHKMSSTQAADYVLEHWKVKLGSSTIRMRAKRDSVSFNYIRRKFDIGVVRAAWEAGVSPADIVNRFNISRTHLYKLAKVRQWNPVRHTSTKVDRELARRMWNANIDAEIIASTFRVKTSHIYKLRNKLDWKRRKVTR